MTTLVPNAMLEGQTTKPSSTAGATFTSTWLDTRFEGFQI